MASNTAATFPPKTVYVDEPAPGTAFQLDRFMTSATSAAQLADIILNPRGTKYVQLLSQTYDITDLLPAYSQVRVVLRCIGPQPARIVNTGVAKTWTLYTAQTHIAFEGINLDIDYGTYRLERVSCTGMCTATGAALNLTLKDCTFTGPVNLGVGDLNILDCEFDALTIQPVSQASLKTCIHTNTLTVLPPTGPNARVYIHGSLFRPPAELTNLVPMLVAEMNNGGKMHISNTVIDMEAATVSATIGNLVRLSASEDNQIFMYGLTIGGMTGKTLDSIIFSIGVGLVQLGVINFVNSLVVGNFASLIIP